MNRTISTKCSIRLLVAFATMISCMLLPHTISAQDEDEYQAELLDWTISVSGPNYTLQNVDLEEYPHGRGERIYITSVESAGFVEVSFFDDEDTPDQTIELMLRDFEAASQSLHVLERDSTGSVYYALARFELEQGLSGYFYIEVAEDIDGNTDLSQSIYTLDADFTEQLSITQTEITLAGMPFLMDPAIDLETIIQNDQELIASSPVAFPEQGRFAFQTNDVELNVDGEIEFDRPLQTEALDVVFLRSEHGYGVVGFIHQDADSAGAVVQSMFTGLPTGDEAPVELYFESNDSRALGVYRVETQGQTRAMVIQVLHIDDGLWKVQAIAVTEREFESGLAQYQRGVEFDGKPLLEEIDTEEIESILNEND